jgi:hypothetical protein
LCRSAKDTCDTKYNQERQNEFKDECHPGQECYAKYKDKCHTKYNEECELLPIFVCFTYL